METFMNVFSVFGSSIDDCLSNLSKVLKRYREKKIDFDLGEMLFMEKKEDNLRS